MDNRLKLINYLGKHLTEKFTMHELSILLDIPYASFYRTVQSMKDLLVVTTIGKAKTIQLKLENPIIKTYLSLASYEEKKAFLTRYPLIEKITRDLITEDIVILFGSYAKEKATHISDIDILVINKEGKKSLSFAKHELLYKKRINPLFITIQEFKDMLRAKEENIGKQVLKGHIILNNPDSFWGCVLDAI